MIKSEEIYNFIRNRVVEIDKLLKAKIMSVFNSLYGRITKNKERIKDMTRKDAVNSENCFKIWWNSLS